MCYIEHSLLYDTLGEDGGLEYVEIKSSILLENVFELGQDLQRHTQLVLDITVIRVRERPGLRVLSQNTSP